MTPGSGPPRDAGFTLLEVLAAVAVAGFVLSAIGALVAVTMAGIRSAGERVALAEAARTLLDSLPQGDALQAGSSSGTSAGVRWRVDVVPTGTPPPARLDDDSPPPPGWRPAAIVITARAASGRTLRLDTIGLLRRSGG